jgi:HK97 family phage major capsid protein
VPTEKCPAVGDVGDIILADLSKYAIGLRQDLQVDASNASGWLTDTFDFRVVFRVDGLPVWDKVATSKVGSTQSWAMVLAAR